MAEAVLPGEPCRFARVHEEQEQKDDDDCCGQDLA